ncbi:ABC transporter permease [Haematobacter massiliensis]|uniref:ABC transporter permease n=1 Tax=Haematobacter massiliensis TaxID=195105 RepID=A0A086Y291_9RHOB|nr:branched-chain amino acid ABC transporter permease [Haematobacter massiliensis]KFI28391.1 ABC transporter permease [Haematobacter massiliensis]OWJ84667.1 branched-chain amino acid ABC transporter permease [Haematobacter massiliensis]
MLKAILSDDLPRSRALALLLCAVVGFLLLAPVFFGGARVLNTAMTIAIFTVLVASYDLLIGYCGIVSFAHAMYYGIGAYAVAIAMVRLGPGWGPLLVGAGAGILLAGIAAALIALVALRVKAIFYTMATMAVASAFGALVLRRTDLTGGDDGLTFRMPEVLSPGRVVFGHVTGQHLTYYLVLACAAVLFLLMLRLVNSRFGRVLEAIRENEFRAEALGYPTLRYRLIANVIAAMNAAAAGVLMAIWLRYVGPQTTIGFNVMLNVLLMCVIGGLGTLYGAVIGVTIFVLGENYIQLLLGRLHGLVEDVPVVEAVLNPERWLLFFGLIFVLAVYFLPTGMVGRLRDRAAGRNRAAAVVT